MAALHRAIAVEQAHDVPVRVGEYLHLHVARLRKITLQQQAIVAEGGARQTLRRFDRRRDLGGGIHHLHPLAAAAGAGLDDERKADALCLRHECLRRLIRTMVARGHGHAHGRHGRLGCAFRAHRADRRRGRPHEDQTRVDAALRECGILRQESVARMHGLGADAPRERDDLRDIQIALGRGRRPQVVRLIGNPYMARTGVSLGVHRNGGHPQALRRACNAADDFAAIGDQQSSEHRPPHIRNTPKRVARISWDFVNASARPSTRRVSSGSMTPSSQRRADA